MKSISIGNVVKKYLALRCALGLGGRRREEICLKNFLAFMKARNAKHITTNLALSWATLPATSKPHWWINRLSMIRCFAKYLKAIDPRTEIPSLRLLPNFPRRRFPYIFDEPTFLKLFNAAKRLPARDNFQGIMYSTLFGLLWSCGLRISEALKLNRDDVKVDEKVVLIRKTKFHKSRLVPIHFSTAIALQKYSAERDRIFSNSQDPSFFVTVYDTRPTHAAVDITFIRLSKEIGLRGKGARHGPRMHDLRHSFAVRTLIQGYKQNQNIDRWLYALSVYLGHSGISSTYWYLTAIPELMQMAQLKFEKFQGGTI
jgi:integrase/recombinase XerD